MSKWAFLYKDTQMYLEKCDPDKHTKAWKKNRICKKKSEAGTHGLHKPLCVLDERSLLWERQAQTLMLT